MPGAIVDDAVGDPHAEIGGGEHYVDTVELGTPDDEITTVVDVSATPTR